MYGMVAASEDPSPVEDDIWLGRPEERELRKLWMRRLSLGLLGMIVLFFFTHKPPAGGPSMPTNATEDNAAALATLRQHQRPASLKYRSGVRCATASVNELDAAAQSCWKKERMAAHASASGLCYFMVEHQKEADPCYKMMQFCLRPLRLSTDGSHGVFSACEDADPSAASVSSESAVHAPQAKTPEKAQHDEHEPLQQHQQQQHQQHEQMQQQQPQQIQLQQQQQQQQQKTDLQQKQQPQPPKRHTPPPPSPRQVHVPFVTVALSGKHFVRNGQPFRFVGTTLWYGTTLAMKGPGGDRERLGRELDKLHGLGVRSVRVLASSEGNASIPYHIVPAITPNAGSYDRHVLEEGLDYLMSELAKRKMLAIMVLTNGQPWSGGLSQYVAWATKTRTPFTIRNTDWDAYWAYVSQFFKLEQAMKLFDNYVKMIVGRKNSITGTFYADDPNILAWEIANEPRGGKLSAWPVDEYTAWLKRVARLIKSLDSNHLVTLGSDGTGGGGPFQREHEIDGIDYTNIHIWPEKYNWHRTGSGGTSGAESTVSAGQAALPAILNRMKDYMTAHLQWSEKLRKPMVVEAFGLAREPTGADGTREQSQRDGFFRALFTQAQESVDAGHSLGGVSFWAWGGEGGASPSRDDGMGWREGSPILGDPPSERQGTFSVFITDESTLNVIKEGATMLNTGA